MSTYVIYQTNGTVLRGMASGTPDEVFARLAAKPRGVRRIDVHEVQDARDWAELREQPAHV